MRHQVSSELASPCKARYETRYATSYRHGESREHTEYNFVNGSWWSGNADLQATSRVGGHFDVRLERIGESRLQLIKLLNMPLRGSGRLNRSIAL